MKSVLYGWLVIGLATLILSGCATEKLGNQALTGIGSTEIDGVHGTFTQLDKDGKVLTKTQYDPESVVVIPQIVYGNVKTRFFEWCPLFGADICSGQPSFFAGARYLEVQRFGLHFGGDRQHFIPFGIDYEKAGIIGGVQLEQSWDDLVVGNLKSVELGFMMALKL